MIITYNGKRIAVPVRRVGALGKIFGLMFRTKNTNNLLFEFSSFGKRAIHSYFVNFSFLAVWLDVNDRVMECKIIKPFTPFVNSQKPFKKLLEIPINERNREIVDFLVGTKI